MSATASYQEIAQSVIDDIASFGISPVPENYAVWFRHLEGKNAALTETINDRLSQDLSINSHFLTGLYDQFCRQDDQSGESLNAVLKSAENEASGLLGLAHAAVLSTGAFGAEIETASVSLSSKSMSESDVRTLVGSLKDTASEAVQRNQELKQQLDTVVEEVAAIRSNLTQVEELANTDALTKLNNRSRFDDILRDEMQTSVEQKMPLCLIVCNIDGFKKFNYGHGYKVGDQALVLVANTIRQNVKGRDLIGRYTGEDFAIVLPQTALDTAYFVAEKLRESVATRKLVVRSTKKDLGVITLSFGVTEYCPGDTHESFVEAAYACLYEAKMNGRNKVIANRSASKDCA